MLIEKTFSVVVRVRIIILIIIMTLLNQETTILKSAVLVCLAEV